MKLNNLNDMLMLLTAAGMDSHASPLHRAYYEKNTNKYPPHNIVKIGENTYRVSMAVAGFSKEEIDISVKDKNLTVVGKKSSIQEEQTSDILYQGLAFRNFCSEFHIGDAEIKSATLENGLLSIDIVHIIPEEQKVKKITIS